MRLEYLAPYASTVSVLHIPLTCPVLSVQVSALSCALSDPTRPSLRCTVLLDCLRGTRGTPNSVAALLPLLSLSRPPRLTLRLYHTPNLRGVVKWLVPERFNEGMGLQHTKIYLFDDTVMLSG